MHKRERELHVVPTSSFSIFFIISSACNSVDDEGVYACGV